MNTSDKPLLLTGASRTALRRKLTAPDAPLAPWWRHFLNLARQDPDWFTTYTILAAVVTDEDRDRELARRQFRRFIELGDQAFSSQDAQFHTHTVSAPLARWAIYFDWAQQIELLTAAQADAIRAQLLDHAFVFGEQQLSGRIRNFDNQILANALGVTTVGYVCGRQRPGDALAQRLLNHGLIWLQELMRRLPCGGYTGEGSTYQEHVVLPVTLFAAVLLQEITGRDVFRDGVAPDGRPLRELLEICWRMIGPAGLMPAWDDYGYQQATEKSGLAYLARLTGDPRPLATIRALNMWYRTTLPAWEIDDRLWTLVWWPDPEPAGTASELFDSWLVPEVAGALQCPPAQLRLFQYWDECGGLASSGRANVDPNAITLEAFGSPILTDGAGALSAELVPRPADVITPYLGQRTIETVKEYLGASFGAQVSDDQALAIAVGGCVGQANALVLDGEGWYVPLAPQRGTGGARHQAGPLQVIRSESAAYYKDRYDVQSVTRTSLLAGHRYVIVCDRMRAATPHAVTWQVFVRGEVTGPADRPVVLTPEQVRCAIVPLQAGTGRISQVKGYPKNLEGASTRIEHALPAAADVRCDVALVPQPKTVALQDLTADWHREINGQVDTVALTDAYLSDPMTAPAAPRVFRKTVVLEPLAGRRYFLELQAAGPHIGLTVNGTLVPPPLGSHPNGIWSDSACHLPWWFEITEALRPGANELCLTTPFWHGDSVCGPARLRVDQPPAPVSIERRAVDQFRVQIGGAMDEVLVENERGWVEWAGGHTDARYALRTADGIWALAAVTRLETPGGLALQSQAPCDVAWSPRETTVSQFVDGTTLEITWPGAELRIEFGGSVNVGYRGAAVHRVSLDCGWSRLVVLNGQPIGGFDRGRVALDLPASQPAVAPAPRTVTAVLALENSHGPAAADALLEAVRGGDWRVQIAAADALGRLRVIAAAPVLLEVLAAEEALGPDPVLAKWWSWGRMLVNNRVNGDDPDLPRPQGEKRWRVKRAVVTALGKLGEPRAVPIFEKMLTRCTDFFPVTSQLALALGRLGSPSSIPVLQRFVNHMEANTRVHARLSLDLLTGKIDRAAFESQAGMA